MKSSTVFKVLAGAAIVLGMSLVGCIVLSFISPQFDLFAYISGITGLMIAILTIINVFTATKQMEIMRNQLDEMTIERELSNQPIIVLDEIKFVVERPRFFYTPPEDEYSFQARYRFFVDLVNATSFPALYIGVSAELIVPASEGAYALGTLARRVNVLPKDGRISGIEIFFSGDSDSKLLAALRESRTDRKPRIELVAYYKSTTGGYYTIKNAFILDIAKDDEPIIKLWHTNIVSAPIEAKEHLEVLRNAPKGEAWHKAFDAQKKLFDIKLGEKSDITVTPREMLDKFSFEKITKDEFVQAKESKKYAVYKSPKDSCLRREKKDKTPVSAD